MNCATYYDLAEQGFGEWWFLFLGLFLGALGIIFFVGAYSVFRERASLFSRLLCIGSMTFAIGWIGISVYQTGTGYYSYRELLEMRSKGEELHVQGIVRNFSPYDLQKNSPTESFEIDNQLFSYSPNDVRAGYHQTRAKGSPVQDGVYLRISHIGDFITRLETCH